MLHNPAHPALNLIPRPAQIILIPGECQISPATTIVADPDFGQEALYLAQCLRQSTGYPIPVTERQTCTATAIQTDHDLNKGQSGEMTISLVKCAKNAIGQDMGGEGYKLVSGSFNITVTASCPAGAFYGIQTLLQLLPPAIFSTTARIDILWKLPKVTIKDRPRFAWRGAMLDCGRHFFTVAEVRKFIDLLALHKLNVFHWHLTEDQGWRIEIRKYPRLTEVGAWRKETVKGHSAARLGADGIAYGGFYTQADIREVVAYAASRHITVVPEIDMPGHSRAAIAAYPHLGSSPTPVQVWTEWGVNTSILNPFPDTIRFCHDVLTEVMELFPGQYIHIGGDEALKTEWLSNPAICAFMQEVGVANVAELQRWFISQMATFLDRHNRRLIGWDEILEGGLCPGATVMSWQGIAGGVKAAQTGHDAIMTPSAFTYLNHYQSENIAEEPISIGGRFISTQMAYEYEPVAAELSAQEATHILGVQACLWTEYINNFSLLEYMAFPRLCAIAETGWTPAESKNFATFSSALDKHLKRLGIIGINYRPQY